MPERPHPDMDRVRDALREAEERDESEPDEAPPEPQDDDDET